jgi:hypothetical protein
MKRSYRYFLILFTLSVLLGYGSIRLYFHLTDGFREEHISSDFRPDKRWETRQLSDKEQKEVDRILSQSFSYLGKGCQSYVFLSEDGEHVLKFFKYQRFRPQSYHYWFTFIPAVDAYLQNKLAVKKSKMDYLFASCRLAFDCLPEETGLTYVHLNKTDHLNKTVTFIDKLGMSHRLDMDRMEFMIQKRASMLCPTIDRMMSEGEEGKAKQLLSRLLAMIVSEYKSGFADNDHALIQNTGVIGESPVHVDVGQFVINPAMKNPELYHQELCNKFYKFRLWLEESHPVLLDHINHELEEEMGEHFHTLRYIPRIG